MSPGLRIMRLLMGLQKEASETRVCFDRNAGSSERVFEPGVAHPTIAQAAALPTCARVAAGHAPAPAHAWSLCPTHPSAMVCGV